jgi:pimeloyl-ACP methyl ester carboxylesterase
MFVTPDSFSALVERLKNDYFIIMPVLDGHDTEDSSVFSSVNDEADKIIAYLRSNDIQELDFVMGTSLGAIIAFEVYRRNAVRVDRLYLDGGPFFRFGPFLRKFAGNKFWGICEDMRNDTQNTVEKLNRMFPGLTGQMPGVCSRITRESAMNLAHACYSFPLPVLSEAEQKAIVFLYGTKEPARFCMFRLRRYKSGSVLRKEGYHHCGYLLSHPDEYVTMLKGK